MKLLFDSLANLWSLTKIAAKDRVDLIMFLIIAILAYLDITEKFNQIGTVGFIAFYLYFCLIRIATLKRELHKLKE